MFGLNTPILVADDMATVRMALIKFLMDLGFTNIVEASNGQMAWNEISTASTPIELVFSDWNMPKINGIELIRLLRADPKYARLVFILVTTEAEAPRVVEAVEAGVDDYVVKPFSVDVIQAKLKAVFKRRFG